MKIFRWLGAAIAVAVSLAVPAGAAEVLAPPHWSSDQVRAARSLSPENALVLDVRTEETGSPDGKQVEVATVTLAPTFTYIDQGRSHILYDHTLCRVFTWSDNEPVFKSLSCYAVPAFLGLELKNRRYLAQVMAAAKSSGAADEAADDAYWPEAELGVQDESKDRLERRAIPEGIEYRLKGRVVVKVTGVATPLDKAERHFLARYFANATVLHPQVRRDLTLEYGLPAKLEIETRKWGKAGHRTLTITNVRRLQMSLPLPEGLTSNLRELAKTDTTFGRGVRQALAGIDGRAKPEKPAFEALLASMKDSSSHGRSSEAMLLFLAMTQQYAGEFSGPRGEAVRNQVIPLFTQAREGVVAGGLWDAGRLAGDARAPGDREAAARFLATATDLDRLTFGTFRYVTYANLFQMTPQAGKWDPAIRKAMPQDLADNYWIHIAGYPWASNVYKDLGDSYYAAYEPEEAWMAYDLGRIIDPDWRVGAIAGLAEYEDQLRLGEPDFF